MLRSPNGIGGAPLHDLMAAAIGDDDASHDGLLSFPEEPGRDGVSGRRSPRRRVGRTTEGERRGSSRDAPGSITTLLLRFSSGKGFDSAIAGDNRSRCPTGYAVAVGYSPERVVGGQTVATHEGIFPTFFLSGFECSTFDWETRAGAI